MVTRPVHQADDFMAALRALGAEPVLFPTIEIQPVTETAPLDEAIRRLVGPAPAYDWLVLTSVNGVTAFWARLEAAGRMTPHGRRHVEAAKADGRWDAAYAPVREATRDSIPDDLRAAIEASPAALATFETLGKQNLFALAYRTNSMKTPAGRARKIEALVAMLARGETIIPQRKP